MKQPAWIPCPDCAAVDTANDVGGSEGEFLCTIHNMHACDCPCPPIDEWTTDPYTVGVDLASGPDVTVFSIHEGQRLLSFIRVPA